MDTLSTLERFHRERRYLKNVTPKTVVWYETAFLALTRAIPLSGPSDLSKPLLHGFVVGLRERGLSPVSCNPYIKALNSFFGWLHAEGHLGEPLTVTPQRTEKRVLQILTTVLLQRLLTFKPKRMPEWRAYVLACTLMDTGSGRNCGDDCRRRRWQCLQLRANRPCSGCRSVSEKRRSDGLSQRAGDPSPTRRLADADAQPYWLPQFCCSSTAAGNAMDAPRSR